MEGFFFGQLSENGSEGTRMASKRAVGEPLLSLDGLYTIVCCDTCLKNLGAEAVALHVKQRGKKREMFYVRI